MGNYTQVLIFRVYLFDTYIFVFSLKIFPEISPFANVRTPVPVLTSASSVADGIKNRFGQDLLTFIYESVLKVGVA